MRVSWILVATAVVSVSVLAACGKKEAPATPDAVQVTTAPTKEPEPDTVAPADTAPAAADDTAAPTATDDTAAPTVAADDAAAAPADDAAAAPADDAAAPTVAAEDAAAATTPAEDAGVAAADAGAPPTYTTQPVAPPKKWDDMTEKEQKDHMKEHVLPVMRERFQAYDPKDFARVTCATCHGPSAKQGKFDMPNPELPKLPKTPAGWKKLAAEKPEAMEFMGKVVKPAMAALVGEEPFDPSTGKGFGCGECHTTEK